MKKISSIIFLFILTTTGLCAQKKYTLDDVQDVYVKSTGTIYENEQIKGYYFLYATDKINRKTNQYVLEILDQNLNAVKHIPFEDSKDIKLLEAAYNGNHLAFLFDNLKKNEWNLKIYSTDGVLKTNYIKSHEKVDESTQMMMASIFNPDEFSNMQLFDVGELGFACIFKTQKMFSSQSEIFFYSTKTGSQWTYSADKKNADLKILGNTDSFLVIGINAAKTFKRGTYTIEGISSRNGIKQFETSLDDDKFSSYPYNKSFETSSKTFLMVGTYVDKDAGVFNRGNGMFICSLDNRGKLLNKTYNTWDDISKYIKVSEKGKFEDQGYLFMKNFIKTSDGKSFIIFEGFDLKRVYDLVIFEFNNENKIVNSTIFPKTKNKWDRTQSFADNHFDYQFTTSNADHSNFSILYKDYLRKEGIEKLSYKIINYNEGKFTNEKFDLETKATIMKVFPAKAGSIMIFEYFRKEKRIDIRLEKLG